MPSKAELQARIQQDPDDVQARLQLGIVLFEDDADREGARAQWEAVTAIDPTVAEAWYNLGFYYADQDPPDCANATAMWAKVVELDASSQLSQNVLNHVAGLCSDAATASPTASETG